MSRRCPYFEPIAETLREIGRPDVPPAGVEVFMRNTYGTLDHLSAADFRREARLAAHAWDLEPAACREFVEAEGWTL